MSLILEAGSPQSWVIADKHQFAFPLDVNTKLHEVHCPTCFSVSYSSMCCSLHVTMKYMADFGIQSRGIFSTRFYILLYSLVAVYPSSRSRATAGNVIPLHNFVPKPTKPMDAAGSIKFLIGPLFVMLTNLFTFLKI